MNALHGKKRDDALDAARGVSLIAMIAYHIVFDLSYFGYIQFDPFFRYLAYPIAGSFIFIAGISLSIKAQSIGLQADYRASVSPFISRGIKILGIAAGITIVTWIYPHEGFIVFGILHLIGISTILAILFLPLGRWNILPAGMIILIWLIFFPLNGSAYLIPLGIYPPGFYTLDYEPLIPWFSLILVGIAAGSVWYSGKRIKQRENRIVKLLAVPGRNSLIIYLIHQPIIIGFLFLIREAGIW
jgi:uncharacterized membrane protein